MDHLEALKAFTEILVVPLGMWLLAAVWRLGSRVGVQNGRIGKLEAEASAHYKHDEIVQKMMMDQVELMHQANAGRLGRIEEKLDALVAQKWANS